MKPLLARCRACDQQFALAELTEGRDGRCPRCSTPLSPDWTVLLVEECAAAETLTGALVRSLRRLSGLPGNLELRPDDLFENLANEVPWNQSIDTEGGLVSAEVISLIRDLDAGAEINPPMAAQVRGLASKLGALATLLDANQEATRPDEKDAGRAARAAAKKLDDAAVAIEGGEADQQSLRDGLRDAAAAQ